MIISNTEITKFSPNGSFRIKHNKIYTVVFIVIIVTLCGLYLHFAWNRYHDESTTEAIILAQSLESVLHLEHIAELSGGSEDLERSAYIMPKLSLMRLLGEKSTIHFAYLLGERDGNIVTLMDSELPESPNYSPPGHNYEEADDILLTPFQSGNTVITNQITDRWGTWISALVPIKDLTDGQVIAVFGIDYSASEWYSHMWEHIIPDLIIVLCVILLYFSLIHTLTQRFALKKLTERLAYDEALYHSVFDQVPLGIAIMSDKSHETRPELGDMSINPMYEQILGWKRNDLQNKTWTEITHPEDLQTDLEKFKQFKNGEISGYSMEKRFIKPDGSTVWVNMTVSPLIGNIDSYSTHLCLLEDISDRKEREKALKESERSKSVLLSHLPGLAYRCNYDSVWTMQYVSAGCFELTGYNPDNLLYNKILSYNDLITPEYRDLLRKEWERILAKRMPFKHEYEIITANGKRKWVLELGEGIFNEKGDVEAIEGIVVDITEHKKTENELIYNNEHDRWTGLFNRSYLEKELFSDSQNEVIDKRALVGINLGGTQSITSAYGFRYTQDLMKKTANTLKRYCTDKRSLFNTYRDRFVFYLKDYNDKNELIEFCTTIAIDLEALLKVDRIVGGIGILEIDKDNDSKADLLLKKLLIASEKAMNSSDKNLSACFYDTDMEAKIMREEDIKHELAQIAEEENDGGLFLHYQPILDLKSNKICSFEALARLNSDKLGLVPPLEFIPLAEKSKLIIPIGQKIIRQAFRFLNKLKENGYGTIGVTINVSAIQFVRNDFIDNLFKLISEMQVNPENIGLELTESIFASNYEEINIIIGKIREVGIHIAIDDFGTGYSSLAREYELNVDCLKIDKYFIDKLLEMYPEKAITGDIISMAHKMGHCAIAEGVEHEEQKQ